MTATTEGVFSPALRLVTVGLLVSVGIVAFDGLGWPRLCRPSPQSWEGWTPTGGRSRH